MYAQLCKRLSEEAPNFEPPNSPCTFRLLLLNKCRAEFESRSQISEALEHVGSSPEDEERRQLAKRKMLGNIKFIGELGKLEILSEGILHRCIHQLLTDKKRRGDMALDMSEDLECLCQIMRTCGRILDSDKGQKLMDQYFERMATLAENMELPPRIRFMLKDVIELRQDGWVPRKATTVEGPMPINQIRPTDEDNRSGNYRRDRAQDRDMDRDRTGSELFRHPMKVRFGIDDMLMGINLGSSSTNLIPTHSDKYSFNPNGFSNHNVREGTFRGHNNQRSGGYNNYNNQRGNYNKQNNQHGPNNAHNSQYNNMPAKELAPRFKKNLIVAKEQSLGDLELRPSANSMLFNQASIKASSNMVMNNRPLDTGLGSVNMGPKTIAPAPTPLLKEPLPIKQVSTEKPKQTKKDKGPNKEDLMKKLNTILEELLKEKSSLSETINAYREQKIPDKFAKDAVLNVLNYTLDKTDAEREKAIIFLTNLRKDSLVSSRTMQEAFKGLCNILEERDTELPKASSCAAHLFARAIIEGITTLVDIATLTENGMHYPLFMLVLQQLNKAKGQQQLTELFNSSKVNLMTHLPESDRTKERLAEILEDRGLTFLYPLLRIQGELLKQLQADPNPQKFYKWIKENLDANNYTDPGFINALMTVLLKYITQETTLAEGCDPTDKTLQEKERSLLERYKVVLNAFFSEHVDLQVVAVYSLQVYCYSLGFPKGMLLRWFIALYDLEVIDEEAFLQWKEDLTDAYPGKGQALFQVNQWLTWLQETESDDEEADD